MRDLLISSSQQYFESHIEKHRVNIETMLRNPIAIPEHTNIIESIEKELEIMAEYNDKLEVLKKYFAK